MGRNDRDDPAATPNEQIRFSEIESLTVIHPGDNWDLTLKRLAEAGALG